MYYEPLQLFIGTMKTNNIFRFYSCYTSSINLHFQKCVFGFLNHLNGISLIDFVSQLLYSLSSAQITFSHEDVIATYCQ